jgi:pimeloyl-ACP methyl ester carboxylesterase
MSGLILSTRFKKSQTMKEAKFNRRRFLSESAMSLAAAKLTMLGLNNVFLGNDIQEKVTIGNHNENRFDNEIKQIDAGVLNIGYADSGPSNGKPVILLHGWPYDIHTYAAVSTLLATKGYRVIVPFLRGFGTTKFLSSEKFRNGQQSALAVDILELMNALKIQKAIIGGCDIGARTANIIAALWPERCKAMVSVSGYLISSREFNKNPLIPAAELQWWYQFYFATERGRAGYDKYRYEFAKLIWQIASPKWNFDNATFDRTASAFDNPDHVNIVIHNYRWRLGLAEGESEYDHLESQVSRKPEHHGANDYSGRVMPMVQPHPVENSYEKKFSGKYKHRTLTGGIGHNLPQEGTTGLC